MEPIAIIGIGCRFPGAKDPEAFWQLLRDGIDAITEVPAERWDLSAFYHPDLKVSGKMNTRWGGFLEKVDQFDRHFFGILPWEAVRMDPQQRLLLEVAWEALEDAGQVVECLAGTQTGVFIGIGPGDYGRIQVRDPNLINAYTNTGNLLSIAANRISYLFDFRGPSMSIDTACSSSLVTVHLACQSLWNGESTLALAGGVNLILSPELTIGFSKAGAMSPDGRCKAFDARANGYVRGEGAGLVVLKPLSSALADHDPIYAVIRGSAVNNDGRTNGLTAPNRWAQEAVLREAYRRAGVSPGQVQYVETHGTGTLLGDPIEAKALGAVLATDRPSGRRCAIGSVKTNIGHLETAAGIAGLIKVALSLKYRAIPPSLHFHEPNPHIPFDELPLQVQRHLGPWPEEPKPALAGVSSFGFGGTNVHVILEEAPVTGGGAGKQGSWEAEEQKSQQPGGQRSRGIEEQKNWGVEASVSLPSSSPVPQLSSSPTPLPPYLLPLSARSTKALQAFARAYQDFLAVESNSAVSLQDVCYTTSMRRSHHDHRLALVFHSKEELIDGLEAFLQGEVHPGMSSGRKAPNRRSKLVFIFSDQEHPWRTICRELLEQEPIFRATLQQCDDLFCAYAGWSLLEELTVGVGVHSGALHPDQDEVSQLVLFALQVALVALWRSWGIEPDAVVGHSIGEVTAAYVAGVLSLEDAVQIIFHWGRWMQRTTWQGARPESTEGKVVAMEPPLELTDSFKSELVKAPRELRSRSALLPIFSTIKGRVRDGQDFHVVHWSRQLREPAPFTPVVNELVEEGYNTFLELSPHPALLEEISQCLHRSGREGAVLPSLRCGEEIRTVMLEALGTLYTLGYSIDWSKLYPAGGRCVRLPSYPWQRERCWLEPDSR